MQVVNVFYIPEIDLLPIVIFFFMFYISNLIVKYIVFVLFVFPVTKGFYTFFTQSLMSCFTLVSKKGCYQHR